jgi:hypothetical protein
MLCSCDILTASIMACQHSILVTVNFGHHVHGATSRRLPCTCSPQIADTLHAQQMAKQLDWIRTGDGHSWIKHQCWLGLRALTPQHVCQHVVAIVSIRVAWAR